MKKHLLIVAVFLPGLLNHLAAQAWSLNGNAGTNTANNFLGTTDGKALVIRTNNVERLRVGAGGKIGVGTKNPLAYFHLYGTMQIENNAGTIAGEPLLTLRNSAANGTTTNPGIAFKGEDTLFATMGYDFSTRDIVISAQPALYAPNLIVNHDNGFTGLNTKTPAYQLDVNGTSRFAGNIGVQAPPGSNTVQVGNTTGSVIGLGTAEKISDGGSNQLAFLGTLRPWTDNTYSVGNSGYRWYSVWAANGTIQTSDARDKANIRDLGYGLKEIMQLHPIKFAWKNDPAAGDKLGVIAQEIQKVLPEVVRDWDYEVDEVTGKKTKQATDKLGVMYSDIIPVLIHGMQEQQKEIEELKLQVQQLTAAVTNSSQSAATENKPAANFLLMQNTPNPFSKSTSISYNLATQYKTAQVIISDNSGNTVKTYALNQAKTGTLAFDGSPLPSGTYYYSLVADGKVLDTKTMIINR